MATDTTMSRKQEILDVALREFVQHGEAGTRLHSIADDIGVTKAMIHYYFSTKENLFREAFQQACRLLFGDLMKTLESELPVLYKIDQFIQESLQRFHARPELAQFVITELNRNGNQAVELLRTELRYDEAIFRRQLEEAASRYEIAPVKPPQILANIWSLCLFPCVGRRFLDEMLHLNDQGEYEEFLKERAGVVSDTIINWLTS